MTRGTHSDRTLTRGPGTAGPRASRDVAASDGQGSVVRGRVGEGEEEEEEEWVTVVKRAAELRKRGRELFTRLMASGERSRAGGNFMYVCS